MRRQRRFTPSRELHRRRKRDKRLTAYGSVVANGHTRLRTRPPEPPRQMAPPATAGQLNANRAPLIPLKRSKCSPNRRLFLVV